MTNDYPGYKGAGSFSDEFELKIAHLQFDGLGSERFIQRPYIEGDHDTITIKAPPRPPTSWGDLSYVPSGGYFPPTIPSEEPELEEQQVLVFGQQTVMPAEPVNGFGIPQTAMRTLELMESVSTLEDLMVASKREGWGPKGTHVLIGFV